MYLFCVSPHKNIKQIRERTPFVHNCILHTKETMPDNWLVLIQYSTTKYNTLEEGEKGGN